MDTMEPYYSTNHLVEAVVTSEIKGGYRLKVSVIDLGMYIDGWTLRKSTKSNDDWWLQPPAVNLGSRWHLTVEFDHSKAFWQEIQQECLKALQIYLDTSEDTVDISPESIETGLKDAIDNLFPDAESRTEKAIPKLEDL